MNSCQKVFSACVLALLTQAAFAVQPSGGSSFAVLSAAPDHGGAVTCTGGSIDGDVGSSGPKASVVQTEGCTITGAIIAPVSANVIEDFNDAYDALKGVSQCTERFADTSLGNHTFTPGVYCFDSAVTETDVVWTLDGGPTDTWLFKIGNTAVGALTGTGFSVVMENGDPVPACNVTWWVDAAATMTTSDFKGIIFAGAGITMTGTAPGTPVEGQALAKAGVTLTQMAFLGCEGGSFGGKAKSKCNQGLGNGPEGCDPGNSNQDDHGSNPFDGSTRTNDELGGTPGNPGRLGNE